VSLSPVSLAHLNTMGLTATAEQLVEFQSDGCFKPDSERHYVLGAGSNTIFVEHFAGTVIHPVSAQIDYLETDSHWLIEADAGVNWHALVLDSLSRGIAGLENLALIPGCLGAAPVQNIGAYGVQFAELCEFVDCLELTTGERFRLSAEQCQFDYRHSLFKTAAARNWLVTRVGIRLPKAWQAKLGYGGLQQALDNQQAATAAQICEQVIAVRQSKLPDPAQLGNVGSFFKNPYVSETQLEQLLAEYPELVYFREGERYKLAAGWLIDRLGWKGKRHGGAAVHDKQALVLVNRQQATARDLVGLAWQIQSQVQQEFAVTLEPEACLVGRDGLINLEQAYEITHL